MFWINPEFVYTVVRRLLNFDQTPNVVCTFTCFDRKWKHTPNEKSFASDDAQVIIFFDRMLAFFRCEIRSIIRSAE